MTSAASSPTFSSSTSDYDDQLPVIETNVFGMILDEHTAQSKRKKQQDVKVVRKKREPREYVSKHFTQAKAANKKVGLRRKVKSDVDADTEAKIDADRSSFRESFSDDKPTVEQLQAEPQPQRIYYGLNVDELSPDSDLTDVPSDIGPDPFLKNRSKTGDAASKTKKKKKNPSKSPYFPVVAHRHRQHFLTTLPFPPLDHDRFGLMQERLAHDPFRLLIATIFLNKTPGERAMPIFFDLMKRYPTPFDLSNAKVEDVTEMIRTLGFQNQRARKCVAMAKVWVDAPPCKERRYRKLNYPFTGDGRNVKDGEAIGEDDGRIAWEISHLPGLGPYSHDSWRMFCRDELRGLATDWLGKDDDATFEPEWKRVLPTDKELRAWMTWMWLKEGWVWNKETGQRTKADSELLRMARDGGVVQESKDDQHLVVKGLDQESVLDRAAVEKPAGDFIPDRVEVE